MVQKFEETESRIDLENKATDLYDPKFCYPDNDGGSHNIGGFVPMKKENRIQSVFKSNFPSINEMLNNWECIYNQER